MPSTWHRWRDLARRHDNLALAGMLVVLAVVLLADEGALTRAEYLPTTLCTLAASAVVAGRSRHPMSAALVIAVAIFLPEFTHNSVEFNDNAEYPVIGAVFILTFTLGAELTWWTSLFGLIPIVVACTIDSGGGGFNPLVEMVSVGPWLGGLVVASQRRASEQLERRADELEREREIFAVQSVRYERARIARELHDIVAHSVSLMVVQANAGERLAAIDPAGAAEALASISEAAVQAEAEISRLVELLDATSPLPPAADLRIIEELVQRARTSGLAVTCRLAGDLGDLDARAADTAYRLVQEGITNAMKHAPGSAIEIAVQGEPDGIRIQVVNGPPAGLGPGLERAGGGHGLAGMRERVALCGGTFVAAPTTAGGWQVAGVLPHRMARRGAVER
jgi:signal transduction histidine kinase